MTYIVEVSYSTKMHGWGVLDDEICKWVGRKHVSGAGTDLTTGWRDVAFDYKKEADAKKAVLAVKKRLKRGMRVKLLEI